MTKSTSPRSKRPDWAALRKLMESIDTQASMDELVPAWQRGEIPEPLWAPEYVVYLQKALEQRKHGDLLALLDSGRLIHPVLLPVLAEVIRSALNGSTAGRPIAILEVQARNIARLYEHRVGPGKQSAEAFYAWWAERLGVSPDTVKRAVRKPKPGKKKTPKQNP